MTKKTVLTIIPARSGSKRIPGKNIKNFLGKPLIIYAVKQALSCDFVDRVIVDTDSPDIAKIAVNAGAEVRWLRPKKLAEDKSKAVDSYLYDLSQFKKLENYVPDYVMVLHTTSPLREKKDIVQCWNMMQKGDADTILTVCPTHPRFYYLGIDNKLILVNGTENASTNTQEWRPGYILNGCFVYIVKTSALLREKSVITKKTKALICPRWRSVDLDTPEDWVLGEYLYKNRKKIAEKIQQLEKEGRG